MLAPLLCVASCGLEIVPTASIVIGPPPSRMKKVAPLATQPGRGKSSDSGQSAHGAWGLFMQEVNTIRYNTLVRERARTACRALRGPLHTSYFNEGPHEVTCSKKKNIG